MAKTFVRERFAEAMASAGCSQADVARALDVSREAVSKWSDGRSAPRAGKLLKLAQFLDVPRSSLLADGGGNRDAVVEFRVKRKSRKITDAYAQEVRRLTSGLRILAKYLPGKLQTTPKITHPSTAYAAVQKYAGQFKRELGVDGVPAVRHLVDFLTRCDVVIVPVRWGDQRFPANGLHVYLPESASTWVYVNLDSKVTDLRFWILHEIAHALTPSLRVTTEEAEVFADAFAGAVLFSGEQAREVYHRVADQSTDAEAIKIALGVARRHEVSAWTIYKELNRYAKSNNLPEVEIALGPVIAKSERAVPIVAHDLFGSALPAAKQFMEQTRDWLRTPFFELLGQAVHDGGGVGLVASVLGLSMAEAAELHRELQGGAT